MKESNTVQKFRVILLANLFVFALNWWKVKKNLIDIKIIFQINEI